MVTVYTEPFPVVLTALLAIVLMAVFFVMRISISYHFMSTILGRNPFILLIGPPNSGKKRIMEKMGKVETKNYPLVGTFRVCDTQIKGRTIRFISFYSMKDSCTLKKDRINMIRKKPKMIVFIAKGAADAQDAEKQYEVYREVRKLFFDAPAVAVVDKKESNKKTLSYIKRAFGKDLTDTSSLENRIKNLV